MAWKYLITIKKAVDALSQIPGVKEVQDCTKGDLDCTRGIVIYGAAGSNITTNIVRSMDAIHIGIDNLVMTKPSLDDVFIKFTGKQLRTEFQKAPPRAGFRSRGRRR